MSKKTSKERSLEEKHFGPGGANDKYPCFRDDYPWSEYRPDVPDSRFPAKENVVIHGLETDAKKFEDEGLTYKTYFHYKMAADYWNMAGDRRAELIKTLPQLSDNRHADAIDFCYDKARVDEELAEEYRQDDNESIFVTTELTTDDPKDDTVELGGKDTDTSDVTL